MKRKIIKIICVLCVSLCLFGCQSNIDTTHTVNYQEIEMENIKKDEEVLKEAMSVYKENDKKCKNNNQKKVCILKYLNDVYNVASSRVNLDMELLPVFSEKYQNYIATSQAFCEIYLQERDTLVKNSKIIDYKDIKDTNTGTIFTKYIKKIYEY